MNVLEKFIIGFVGTLLCIALGFGFVWAGIALIDAYGWLGLVILFVGLSACAGVTHAMTPDDKEKSP